jgi:hypothetical protein
MYKDITKTSGSIRTPNAGNFNKYMAKLVDLIAEANLFRSVGILVRETEAIQAPMCVLIPMNKTRTEQLTGATVDVRYTISVAVALMHPDDSIITQMILDYAEELEAILSNAAAISNSKILLFNDIPGHYNTEIQFANFGDVKQLSETVLAYNTGINVVFSAFETR